MKKCPKCGQEYSDSTSFCAKCGERLGTVKKQACPKCGGEIGPTDKFCPTCGVTIIRGIRCPGCGKVLPSTTKFCPDCGEKIGAPAPRSAATRPESVASEPAPKAPKEKKPAAKASIKGSFYDRHHLVMTIIFASALWLLSGLLILAIFGNPMKGEAIDFFFGAGIKEVNNTVPNNYPLYKSYMMSCVVVSMILYYGTIAGVAIHFIYGIIIGIKAFRKDAYISPKFFYIIPFILTSYVAAMFYMFAGSGSSTNLGWGAIVGMIVSISAIGFGAVLTIFQGKKIGGRIITRNSFYLVGSILLVVLALFGLTQVTPISGYKYNASGLYLATAYGYPSGTPLKGSYALALVGNVFGVASVILLCLTIFKFGCQKYGGAIVFGSIFLGTSVLQCVFNIFTCKEALSASGAKFGAWGIVAIVFAVLVIGFSIASKIMLKKERA